METDQAHKQVIEVGADPTDTSRSHETENEERRKVRWALGLVSIEPIFNIEQQETARELMNRVAVAASSD